MRKILGHIAIILSGMIFILLIIDSVNPAMAFINNDITKTLLGILCIITIINTEYYVFKFKNKNKN